MAKQKKTTRRDKNNGYANEKTFLGSMVASKQSFTTSRLVEIGLFYLFSTLLIVVCFLGQKEKGPQLILKQAAQQRIVSELTFEYPSEVLAEERRNAVRTQVPPVFKRTYAPYDQFRELFASLLSSYAQAQIEFEDQGEERVLETFRMRASELINISMIDIDIEILIEFINQTSPRERSSISENALSELKKLYEDGIYESRKSLGILPQITVIQLTDEEGKNSLPNTRSLEKATIDLRVRINSLSREKDTARILFEIFRPGLAINLVYSELGTTSAINNALAQVETPLFHYDEGDTLIEPGSIISPLDIERIVAYRDAVTAAGGDPMLLDPLFLARFFLTGFLLTAVFLYIKQGLRDIRKRNRSVAITAVCVLLNLLLIRAIFEIGEIAAVANPSLPSMLPFIAPCALAPLLVSVLVGAGPAALSALVVSVCFGIMLNNSIEFMLIAFLSGITGSYFSTHVRQRSKLVRAGLFAGLAAALAGSATGLLAGFSFGLAGQQAIIAVIIGLVTGIIAVGILPVLENLFKITTEITLLELTDFNHPLLRRMQMEAPGTYHHSLMVANLSENAAAAIGASPLLCRVCSFFHDIGKLVKPEYFVENQRDGINPHSEKSPSMSALVIKAHVKEGLDLAKKHKLPQVISDVIGQHHGSTLIQYFYHRAKVKQQGDTPSPISGNGGRILGEPKVEESTYRYDGPLPAFKESAIIFFADSIEAASRTLPKVTQPSIEELINKIFNERIEDRQLDECPLTFQELARIKSSFTHTLLNMLHARIEYPKENAETSDQEKQHDDNAQDDTSSNLQPV
ncbi:MAG: HD family phosphohydrolase [Coraliomargaritaceae bacterium]